ncbi:Rrf2 family transcriptional regulator [Sideroxydans lithotrophicus]|uniref:Transcriptional regulator, BadM/Rrf2 family n=1 Tax=Sideroxydans lithotrophicus (strain ES-1) TaxID=580332 RepID=D5CMC8_SIDLE|nr:Rrf2 family transcriptional regulator [Sideroxydans lithotrophicus]ADE12600.1 transcriptional regulator, BadM/Rrf2 family [Sideroxydans lithotrophicus ES-1]
MRLTIYTDYSLRVLLYLASKPGETATITEISDFYNISRNHLVKVVHNLGLNEFIITSRGKNGGIKLARAAEAILLSDVVRKTEPDMDLLECFNESTDNCVISSACRLKSMLYEGRSAFMAVLEKNTLADAARPLAQARSGKTVVVDVSNLRR